MYIWASCLSMIKHRNPGTRQGKWCFNKVSDRLVSCILHSLATGVETQQEQGANRPMPMSWLRQGKERAKVGCHGHIPHRHYIISQRQVTDQIGGLCSGFQRQGEVCKGIYLPTYWKQHKWLGRWCQVDTAQSIRVTSSLAPHRRVALILIEVCCLYKA